MNTDAALAACVTGRGEPIGTMTDPDFAEMVNEVAGTSLMGFVVDAARRGVLTLTTDQDDQLSETEVATLQRIVAIERTALDAGEALTAAGVHWALMKGLSLAHGVYPSPEIRHFTDVDLLVAAADVDRAIAVLGVLGARRMAPPYRRGWDARYAKDIPMYLDGTVLDVHRTVLHGPFAGRVDTGVLLATARPLDICGRPRPALGIAGEYVVALANAGVVDHPPRWATLRDVGELIGHRSFDDGEVLDLVAKFGLQVPETVTRSAATALGIGGCASRDDWSARRWDRFLMRAHHASSGATTHLLTAASLHGVSRKTRGLFAALTPSREYVHWRGDRRIGTWRGR